MATRGFTYQPTDSTQPGGNLSRLGGRHTPATVQVTHRIVAGVIFAVLASACGGPPITPAVPLGTPSQAGPTSTPTPVPSPTPTPESTADPKAILAEVARTSPTSAELRGMSRKEQAQQLLRCFDLAGLTYCLGFGFCGDSPPNGAVYASIAKIYEAGEWNEPGAESAAGYFKKRLEMTNAKRIAAEQHDVAQAIRGIDKMKGIEVDRKKR